MAVTYVTTDTLPTPNAADEVYIQQDAPNITGNLDWSAVAAAAIFEVPPNYLGQIGSSSTPLKMACSDHLSYLANAGNIYWNSDDSGANTTAKAVVDSRGTGTIGGGTVTRLEVNAGTVYVGTSAVVTNLRVTGGTVYVLDDGSTDPTTVENYGGYVHLERKATTLTHVRGTTMVSCKGATETIGTVNCYGPGLQLKQVAATTGTITTLNAFGGIPDTTLLERKVTITTSNVNVRLPGAGDFVRNPLVTQTPAEYW